MAFWAEVIAAAAPVVVVAHDGHLQALAQLLPPSGYCALLSPEAAGLYGGPAWFEALARRLAALRPDCAVSACLDCADRPGLVLAALRVGLPAMVLQAEKEAVITRLQGMARQQGATVLPVRPAAIDPERLYRSEARLPPLP